MALMHHKRRWRRWPYCTRRRGKIQIRIDRRTNCHHASEQRHGIRAIMKRYINSGAFSKRRRISEKYKREMMRSSAISAWPIHQLPPEVATVRERRPKRALRWEL